MIKIFQLLLVLFSVSAFAQIKGTIQDSQTKEPIPYVNISVQGEKSIEFSADENGNFTIPEVDSSAKIVLSAVGYANTTLGISEIKDNILLTPKPIELAEVVIANKKGEHSFIVNPAKKVKKSWLNIGGCIGGSLLFANYIAYKQEYAATPYLDKIRFTVGYGGNYTFNVRLQSVNANGSPGEYLHNANILVKVKKKQKYAEVDFSKTHIQIPNEGLFIIVEYLAIKDNRLDLDVPQENFPAHLFCYGPSILFEMSKESLGWAYKEGQWQRNPKTEKGYAKIAIEMTLTD